MSYFEGEQGYLNLLKLVLDKGEQRCDRTSTGTLSIFSPPILHFDVSSSVPLYTTKAVPWKSVVKELLWFLRGDTDAKLLQAQGVHIWDGNSSREFLHKRGLEYETGVIGPGYGWQWRHFGAQYAQKFKDSSLIQPADLKSLQEAGIDQIAYVENLLKTDPTSRRIFLSSWNPKDIPLMALPPCHVTVQFYVTGDIKVALELSAHVYMRSNDLFLGNPFNVFSYSVLLYLLAKRANMTPKDLFFSLGDAHIYMDHLDQVNVQLGRTVLPPPSLEISDDVITKDWNEIGLNHIKVVGYEPHPKIMAQMSV